MAILQGALQQIECGLGARVALVFVFVFVAVSQTQATCGRRSDRVELQYFAFNLSCCQSFI
jgi:hypothetical protein